MIAAAVRRRAPQAATAAGVVAVIVTLHLLGRGALAAPRLDSAEMVGAWARERDPVSIGFAVLRMATLAVAYHLVATTLLMAIGRVLHLPGIVRLADAATLPPLRGTIRRLVGLGLSTGIAISQPLPTAHASPQARLAVVASGIAADPADLVVVERIAPGSTTRAVLRVIDDDATTPFGGRATIERVGVTAGDDRPAVLERIDTPSSPTGRATVERVDLDPQSPARHVVEPGDHLWSIAHHQVADAVDRPPTDAEVGVYWQALIIANPQIVDPDVLFPGDEVSLPPAPTS